MCKVLLIDDEEMILQLVEQALHRLDYSVETAENGRKGIDKFDAGIYELGNWVSGHTLKHLAASLAPLALLYALQQRKTRQHGSATNAQNDLR